MSAVPLPGTAALAPMAGVTDLPFRLLCRELGSAWAVTEMVSAKGFCLAPKSNRAAESLLLRAPQEGPVALQLFGSEPAYMARAAEALEDRDFFMVDINMGCPAPKITGGGEGSALMKEPLLAARIIEAVVRAVKKPVSVKMRLGWDEDSRCETDFARMAEGAGASLITVHGRTRAQGYAGRADWAAIGRVKRAVAIPVVGNGDVASAEDALRMLRETGCDAVMVGRGAMGNPWIFREIARAMEGLPVEKPCAAERVNMALRHTRMLMAWKGEAVALREMRGHAARYMHGLHGAAKMRARINGATTYAQLIDIMADFQHTLVAII